MQPTIEYRGLKVTPRQLLRASIYAVPLLWVVLVLIMFLTEFRDAPRQAAALMGWQMGQAERATATVVTTRLNVTKQSTRSYDVEFTFVTAAGQKRNQTQRIPSANWLAMQSATQQVWYSPTFPRISTLSPEASWAFVKQLIGLPLIIVTVFGLVVWAFCGPIFLLKWLLIRSAL